MSSLSPTDVTLRGAGALDDPLPVTGDWRVSLINDETANDSDKTFTVPADTEYQILWIWVEFTTGAGADRQLEVEIQDTGTDVIATWAIPSVVQGAAITRNYLFAPGVVDLAGFRDTDFISTPIPVAAFLQEGDILRIFDNNVVDVAADDMIVQIQIASRAV